MQRRTVLTSIAALAAGEGLAGCTGLTGDGPGDRPSDTPFPSSTATTDGDPTATGTRTDDASQRSGLTVEVEPVNYVVKTYQVPVGRGLSPDDIVPEDDIPDVLRAALSEAVDGTFVTDSVSTELLAAIDQFRYYDRTSFKPYVRLDGTGYEFDPTVPTFVARLADEDAEEYDTERVAQADSDFGSEAVNSFVHALAVRGTHVPRSEYRTSVVPASVETFLEEFDYIEDPRGVARIQTGRINTNSPFSIAVRELTDEDRWGRPVVDGDTLEEKLQTFLRTALQSTHRAPATDPTCSEYFTDEVPSAFSRLVDDQSTQYVRLDGTVYDFNPIRATEAVPVKVSVEERTPSEDARQQFGMTVNISDAYTDADVSETRGVTLTSSGALPSVLWVTHEGERYLLDSDAYDREKWRESTDGSDDGRRPVNEVLRSLAFGEELSAVYTVPEELPEGTYVSRGYFTISWNVPGQTQEEHGFVPFRVLVTIPPE